jgi:hypothetical protein
MGDYNKGYRTLTVDLKTYELLEEICSIERRKKIDQIRLMVETNHKKVIQQQEGKLYNLGGIYVGRTFPQTYCRRNKKGKKI